MTGPLVGGRILDPSALVALLDGRLSALAWLTVAVDEAITLWVPELARVEVETVRPHEVGRLGRLGRHPQVRYASLSAEDAVEVDALLAEVGMWDATAAVVVHQARRRGWDVLTTDPGRLRRIDSTVNAWQL